MANGMPFGDEIIKIFLLVPSLKATEMEEFSKYMYVPGFALRF